MLCLALIALGWRITRPANYAKDPLYAPTTRYTYTPTTSPTIEVEPSPIPTATPAVAASVQMLLGNPSDATPDESNRDNYLMLKPYFAVAYNNSGGEPRRALAGLRGTVGRVRDFGVLPKCSDQHRDRDANALTWLSDHRRGHPTACKPFGDRTVICRLTGRRAMFTEPTLLAVDCGVSVAAGPMQALTRREI